jgi:hypothetical protein
MRSQASTFVSNGHFVAQAPMPSQKMEAFLGQFPWVTKFVSRDAIDHVYVSGIDSDLMRYRPVCVDRVVGRNGQLLQLRSARFYESLWVVDEQGQLVAYRQKRVVRRRVGFVFSKEKTEVQITWGMIGERVNIGRSVGDVLTELQSHSCFSNHQRSKPTSILSYFEPMRCVIVYQMPVGHTIAGWLKKQNLVERGAVLHECERINMSLLSADSRVA